MNKFASAAKSKLKSQKKENNNELMSFVANQFKQLSKKHLRVPIQLYTL